SVNLKPDSVAAFTADSRSGKLSPCSEVAHWREKHMAERIKAGTILIKEGTPLPECLQFESEPYSNGWRSVKNLDAHGLDRKIAEARWTFFFIAGVINPTFIGSDSVKTQCAYRQNLNVDTKARRVGQSEPFS